MLDREGPLLEEVLDREGPLLEEVLDREGPLLEEVLDREGPLLEEVLDREGPLLEEVLDREGPLLEEVLDREGPLLEEVLVRYIPLTHSPTKCLYINFDWLKVTNYKTYYIIITLTARLACYNVVIHLRDKDVMLLFSFRALCNLNRYLVHAIKLLNPAKCTITIYHLLAILGFL